MKEKCMKQNGGGKGPENGNGEFQFSSNSRASPVDETDSNTVDDEMMAIHDQDSSSHDKEIDDIVPTQSPDGNV